MSLEIILLGLSVLFLLSIMAGKASSKFGVPALLLFLLVGMLCGSDGLGIQFDNTYVAQTVGTVALCIILFSGGMETKIAEIKPVLAQGLVLATVGVALMSVVTGVLVWFILGMTMKSAGIGLATSLLLASTMSSTDSASVFAILRSKGLHLKNNLRPMLELESGSNDPMAYILVFVFMDIVKAGSDAVSVWYVLGMVAMQLCVGMLAGFAFGKLAVWAINRIKIDNASLYPILVFTFCIFIFSATYFMKGNGYLAVYIGGLVIGNSSFQHKRSTMGFFNGLTWLFQLLMFLTLGLLVNPHELLDVWIPGLIISVVMIFISRPISVMLSLLPFRKIGIRDKIYVSWCGLRGAVPIIFAIMPLAADVPQARFIFNIVFFCTLVSLLVQGTSLPAIAKWLKLDDQPDSLKGLEDFDVDFSDEIKSVTTEITVTDKVLECGNRLMDWGLPDKTLVVMVKRGGKFFVPTGKTVLHEGDKLLVITDDQNALKETYKTLHIAG